MNSKIKSQFVRAGGIAKLPPMLHFMRASRD